MHTFIACSWNPLAQHRMWSDVISLLLKDLISIFICLSYHMIYNSICEVQVKIIQSRWIIGNSFFDSLYTLKGSILWSKLTFLNFIPYPFRISSGHTITPSSFFLPSTYCWLSSSSSSSSPYPSSSPSPSPSGSSLLLIMI